MSDEYIHLENLKADDCIKSSGYPLWTNYNCLSWAGGITKQDIFPWYMIWEDPAGPDASFDNYMANRKSNGDPAPRHASAWDYTQEGANYSNAVIDVWGHAPEDVAHASVRKPAEDYMHGYDWESKCGGNDRILHPREDVGGNYYGHIRYHYIPVQGKALGSKMMTEADAIAARIQVVPPRERYSTEEALLLDELLNSISKKDRELFASNCKALDYELANNKALRMHTNPEVYKKTKEYQAFITHCEKLGDKALPLLFNIIGSNDQCHFMYRIAITDLCKKKYGHILKEIVDDWVHSGQYTADGKFSGYCHKNTMIKFAKRLLHEKL